MAIQRQAGGVAPQAVEHPAVGHHQDRAASVRSRQRFDRRHDARRELPQALARFERVLRVPRAEAAPVVGVQVRGFVAGQPLEDAQMSLAQTGIGNQRMAGVSSDPPCGVERAPEVADVERLDRVRCQAHAERVGL